MMHHAPHKHPMLVSLSRCMQQWKPTEQILERVIKVRATVPLMHYTVSPKDWWLILKEVMQGENHLL